MVDTFSEALLHFVWKTKLFDLQHLKLTDGRILTIDRFGMHNHDAGPDFLDARITIEDTTWVGHIEMHLKASDWIKHQHSHDKAYQNVILHVVYEKDADIDFFNNGEVDQIPTLELKGRITDKIIHKHQFLQRAQTTIACEKTINQEAIMAFHLWQSDLLVERINRKSNKIEASLAATNNDWEACFFQQLSRYFGGTVNADAFESLAQRTPYLIVLKNINQATTIESLLFGQAGFFTGPSTLDDYGNMLAKEYHFLQHKYQLTPLNNDQFKFLRMLPAGFPTIRLAQLSQLLTARPNLFAQCLEADSLQGFYALLQGVKPAKYWENHYKFGKATEKTHQHSLSRDFQNRLLINAIWPLLFIYHRAHGDYDSAERVIGFYDEMESEQNKKVKDFQDLGFQCSTAMNSQALLQLRTNYCEPKNCLNCRVGLTLFKS